MPNKVSAVPQGVRKLSPIFPVASSSFCYLALGPGILVPGVNSTVLCYRTNTESSIWETSDAGLSTGAALRQCSPGLTLSKGLKVK